MAAHTIDNIRFQSNNKRYCAFHARLYGPKLTSGTIPQKIQSCRL